MDLFVLAGEPTAPTQLLPAQNSPKHHAVCRRANQRMNISYILSCVLIFLSVISISSSFAHQILQSSMSGNIASSLRCSSRLKSSQSPYFNSAVSRPRRSSPYFTSASATADDTVDMPVTPTRHESKRKDSGGGSKKSVSPNKRLKASPPKVERTQSFEPAWWGNVLVNRTQSTLVSKSSSQQELTTPTKTNYPPIHTLIVGTHPSIVSLSSNQFYGHPLNAFWYLVGDSMGFRRCPAISPTTNKPYVNFHDHLRYGMDKIIDYDKQLETFVSKGFALWDIVQECERKGSLDTDIKVETPNPIREFCNERGSVKRIVIANGTTGGKFFVKHFKDWFTDGGLVAGEDELSQRVFKAVMNSAKKMSAANVGEVNNGDVIEVVCLPSVSPAAAKFSYLEKRELWEKGCFEPGSDYASWKNQTSIVTPTPLKRPANKSSTKPSSTNALEAQFVSSDLPKLSRDNDWVDLCASPEELRASATLTNGQCFNWMVVDKASTGDSKQSAWGTHDAKEWVGPLMNRVFSIKETPTTTLYRVLYGSEEGATDDLRVSAAIVLVFPADHAIAAADSKYLTISLNCLQQSYFRLETPLAPLYKEWSEADHRLAKIATVIPGCRILRQDPIECMFSFICSSNNNIPRITKMLTSFRQDYGDFMMKLPTQNGEEYSIYSFPTLDSLSSVTEQDLRAM